ncbi:hypothetical protein [Streptomonospora litoralis]|uniref:Uncharacterized protein n=1 Tax=Streptomonospora litoralis TaxID=2498135 RepID=A0A4P6QAA6_9ACTN|nr:hypothetical protein [Streptomonospora litoralis]QBI56344.1 hypothetical protein EKD16_22955 [Streptomonospora litoralis]
MDGILQLAAGLAGQLPVFEAGAFDWENGPALPNFGTDGSGEQHDPIQQLIGWGQGVIIVIGIIGILFAAGKMAIGKFGRSDLAADGVGGLVWTVMGISLMLVAIPVIRAVAGVVGGS